MKSYLKDLMYRRYLCTKCICFE